MEERELRAGEVVWALQKKHGRWAELTGRHRSFFAGRIRWSSRLKEAEVDVKKLLLETHTRSNEFLCLILHSISVERGISLLTWRVLCLSAAEFLETVKSSLLQLFMMID